ncbi:MAG: nucleoid-associated protein [Methanosarcinales archaeon]|jgi:hypothetical protein|nr:nucleoid-associated protein [Methanosarcinales archaeon]
MSTIEIKNFIIHTLNTAIDTPTLSEKIHSDNKSVEKYLQKHITKIMADTSLKNASFIQNSEVLKECKFLKSDINNFANVSQELATSLFQIMKMYSNIPAGDVVFCTFEMGEIPYFGMLKLKYKSSFIHNIKNSNNIRYIEIQSVDGVLPSTSQKIDESFFVNLDDFAIKVLENTKLVNSQQAPYLPSSFLKCTTVYSEKENVDSLLHVIDQFSKEYLDEKTIKSIQLSKAIAESVEETRSIIIEDIADDVFFDDPEIKKDLIQEVINSGIKDAEIVISDKTAKRKTFKIQKLETDDGIEINLPYEVYGNVDKIEFIINDDGTTSIIIKNVKVIA